MVPSGLKSPSTSSRPPPNSARPATVAQNCGGRNPSDTSQPAVPLTPCPPNQPNSFCAPCPATSSPPTTLKINRALSMPHTSQAASPRLRLHRLAAHHRVLVGLGRSEERRRDLPAPEFRAGDQQRDGPQRPPPPP